MGKPKASSKSQANPRVFMDHVTMMRELAINRLLPHKDDSDPVGTSRLFWDEVILALRSGELLDPKLAQHAAGAIEACLCEPEHACRHLGLRRRKGRPNEDAQDFELAKQVQLRLEQGLCLRYDNDGAEHDDAIGRVAKENEVERDTVKRAWERFKDDAHCEFRPAFFAPIFENPEADRQAKRLSKISAKAVQPPIKAVTTRVAKHGGKK